MDKKNFPQTVEGCHKLISQLLEVTDALVARTNELVIRIERLEEENKALKEQLNTNSQNSSLPPSKDKKKKKKDKGPQNKGGGQAGHKGHSRKLLHSDEVDEIISCTVETHCDCGGRIELKEDYQRHQVYELPKVKLRVTEYRLAKGQCSCCGLNHVAHLPEGVTWGITGPHLTSFMSHMVSKYKLSRRELVEFLKEHYGFSLSLGSVFNKQKLVNKALDEPVKALLEQIKQSICVNMDETSHRRDGTTQWLWGMMSPKAAFFSIETSRGKKVIHRLMEGFEHIIISDRYAAYNYFDSDKRQVCWSHLKRDFTRISEKKDEVIARIGKNLLRCQAELFEIWHQFKQGYVDWHELAFRTKHIRKQVGEYLEQGTYTDPKLKIVRFCKNLLEHFSALWTFLFIQGVEPTNNHAERCLRPAVIWRKKSFGTRSDYGTDYVAKTMSFILTCKLQARNSFEFLKESMTALFENKTAPKLILN
ncbi:IS66 family transposase [Legionella pneumophila]